MAQDAGYTYMRIWGGGLVEDQLFYDLCDEYGIMLQQDFPLAGCGWSTTLANGSTCKDPSSSGKQPALGSTCSYDWMSKDKTKENGLSVLRAQALQMPIVLRQLMSHPSVVRYTVQIAYYIRIRAVDSFSELMRIDLCHSALSESLLLYRAPTNST